MSGLTVDVVVVTWRNHPLLERCLERLSTQTLAHTTIVVDNEADGTTARLIADRFPDVRLLELAENRGFGRAVNAGAQLGHGEAIVLVNDDVEPEPGFLSAIVEPFVDERVGMAAGLTLIPGSDLVDGFGIELDVTLAAYNRLRGAPPGSPSGRLAGPSGGAAAYRRVAFDAAGGFDERLFAYGEDVDLALRLRSAGWTASGAPGARGVHLGGATAGVASPDSANWRASRAAISCAATACCARAPPPERWRSKRWSWPGGWLSAPRCRSAAECGAGVRRRRSPADPSGGARALDHGARGAAAARGGPHGIALAVAGAARGERKMSAGGVAHPRSSQRALPRARRIRRSGDLSARPRAGARDGVPAASAERLHDRLRRCRAAGARVRRLRARACPPLRGRPARPTNAG